MKSFFYVLEQMLVAATFAEAGEQETAKKLLEQAITPGAELTGCEARAH